MGTELFLCTLFGEQGPSDLLATDGRVYAEDGGVTVTALILRSIELALHWVLLGGLAGVGIQLHEGRNLEAFTATLTAAVSIIALALAYKVARKIMRR